MTIGQCYDKVRKLLNYYSAGGVPLPAREGDLWPRAAAAMDTAYKELVKQNPRFSSRVLTQRKLVNLLPRLAPFWVGEKTVELSAEGAQSLTFATDGPLEVSVTRTANGVTQEVAVISCPEACTQVYSAGFDAAQDALITVRMSGSAYVWDAALYAERFSDAQIPACTDYRWQALPQDCAQVRSLTLHPVTGGVKHDTRDYRLKKGEIGLPWRFNGTATLVYEQAPAPITEDTEAQTELELDEEGCEGIVYFAAAQLVAEENPGLYELLMGIYRAILLRSRPGVQPQAQVNTLYGSRVRGLVG